MPIRAIKFLLKLLASLASAIVVVSGYLFFVSNVDQSRNSDIAVNDPDLTKPETEMDPQKD